MDLSSCNGVSSWIVTHGDCPDGSACVVFAKSVMPEIQVVFGYHKNINQQILEAARNVADGGVLLVSDICCDEDVLQYVGTVLSTKNAKIGIYEHHETRSFLNGFKFESKIENEIVFDNDRCGSRILFQSFLKNYKNLEAFEDFSAVINDRDIWLNKDDRGLVLAKLHQIYGDQKFINRFLKNAKVDFDEAESLLLEYVQEQEQRKIKSALTRIELQKDNAGFKYGVVYDSGDSSDLLNKAIEDYDLEYAVMLDLHRGKGSIRGRGNMDCSKFAEQRGGGGHKRASGFPIYFDKPKV